MAHSSASQYGTPVSPVVSHEPHGSPVLAGTATVADWLRLIRAEYLEIPGLCLTLPQATRLWSLDPMTCEALLAALMDVKFLRRTERGAYVRDRID